MPEEKLIAKALLEGLILKHQAKGVEVTQLVNEMLRRKIKLIEAVK